MPRIAIIRNEKRPKSVINTLVSLGGNNVYAYNGCEKCYAYTIDSNNTIIRLFYKYVYGTYVYYTLDNFIETFPFKIGETVYYIGGSGLFTIHKMKWLPVNETVSYEITDKLGNSFNVTKKEIFMMNNNENKVNEIIFKSDKYDDNVSLVLGDEFEIKQECGKFFVRKKPLKYPETFEECCKIMDWNCNDDRFLSYCVNGYGKLESYHTSYYGSTIEKVSNLYMKLKICRDAFWKIDGDWTPSWANEMKLKYTINYFDCDIDTDSTYSKSTFLAFKTEKSRDTFLELFEDLIMEYFNAMYNE